MPYRFTDLAAYPYKPGSLFLGINPDTLDEVGVETERNAITIAGAGSGKGTCLIIPNLLRWPFAALVIDPKGENAEETWKARKDMGQRVGVIDPFGVAKVPKRLRVSINPLTLGPKPDVLPTRDDIQAVADGIVKRDNRAEPHWDDGARAIVAGVIAFVCEMAPPEARTLAEARRVLMQPETLPPDDQGRVGGLRADAKDMTALGGLAAAAGVSILSALDKGKGADSEYLAGARRHTAWLDSPEIDAALSSTTFRLADLAKGKASLFIVLPYGKMDTYAAFLRMLVRAAQNTIAEAGNKRGPDQRCLFILDEFYTLGRIDEIQKAAGNMRSYGLQLWPFLQDFGQLRQLYGEEGAETFFSNADAQIYFGNTDTMTLARVSGQLDKTLPDEAAEAPPDLTPFKEKTFYPFFHKYPWESEEQARARHATRQRNARDVSDTNRAGDRALYEHKMKRTGSARLPPNEVAALVGRGNDDKVARSALVFTKLGHVLNVKLAPFFETPGHTVYEKDGTKSVITKEMLEEMAERSSDFVKNTFYPRAVKNDHFLGYFWHGCFSFFHHAKFDYDRGRYSKLFILAGNISLWLAAVYYFEHHAVIWVPLLLLAVMLFVDGYRSAKLDIAMGPGRDRPKYMPELDGER